MTPFVLVAYRHDRASCERVRWVRTGHGCVRAVEPVRETRPEARNAVGGQERPWRPRCPYSSPLRALGWTTTFVVASFLSLVACAAVYLALPKRSPETSHVRLNELNAWTRLDLAAAWRSPGTRLGLWTTFAARLPIHGVLAALGVPVDGGGRALACRPSRWPAQFAQPCLYSARPPVRLPGLSPPRVAPSP